MCFLFRYENFGCLHDMFKRQALATPEKLAVVANEGEQLTFSELDKKTDVLATCLRRKGVTVDSAVGIHMERCIEYVVAYIAILKAGITSNVPHFMLSSHSITLAKLLSRNYLQKLYCKLQGVRICHSMSLTLKHYWKKFSRIPRCHAS